MTKRKVTLMIDDEVTGMLAELQRITKAKDYGEVIAEAVAIHVDLLRIVNREPADSVLAVVNRRENIMQTLNLPRGAK